MNKKLFLIGEIARLKGITIKALRFYEKIGLIKPCYKDPSTNYRYYSMEQFVQLDIIKASRSMGISPKDVKVILDKKDNNTLLEFMKFQKESAVLKIEELKKTISLIDTVRCNIHNSMSSVLNRDLFFKEIPLRRIVVKELGDKISEEDIILEYSDLYKFIEDNSMINTYETGIIFKPDENAEFHINQIFNTIETDRVSNNSEVSTIQAGKFLCICYNRQNAGVQMEKFNAYLEQNHLVPKLILQVDLLNNVFDSDNPNVELQALI